VSVGKGEYRLLSYYEPAGVVQAGILVGDRVLPVAPLLPDLVRGATAPSVLGLLQEWDAVHPRLHSVAQQVTATDGKPVSDIKLAAPILYPAAIFCAGANYWDHIEEMSRQVVRTGPPTKKPAEPFFFLKTPSHSIVGSHAPVRLPPFSSQVDWEAELGVVISRRTRNVSEHHALENVAGYVIFNDLSARDLMKREGIPPFAFDWLAQKCFDDAAPMGPWLTPSSYIQDPNNLTIKLWVNGVLKQDSNTSRMVHSIAEQIAYLSRHFTLRPGDVIATGTPSGVGLPRGEFLKAGDEVKIEIAGCGMLVNQVIAEQ